MDSEAFGGGYLGQTRNGRLERHKSLIIELARFSRLLRDSA